MHLAGVIRAAVRGGGCAGNILQAYNQEREENRSGIKAYAAAKVSFKVN